MMTQEELINQATDSLLQPDVYYESLATALKTAPQIKDQHRKELMKALEFEDFRQKLSKGLHILVKQMQSSNFIEELKNCQHHAETFEGEAASIQQVYGFSDRSMELMYKFGGELIQKEAFDEAEAVFVVLTFLNPLISEYYIGAAISLFWQRKFPDCLACVGISKILQPEKAVSFIYSALSKIESGDTSSVKEDVQKLDEIFDKSPEQKKEWQELYNLIKIDIK